MKKPASSLLLNSVCLAAGSPLSERASFCAQLRVWAWVGDLPSFSHRLYHFIGSKEFRDLVHFEVTGSQRREAYGRSRDIIRRLTDHQTVILAKAVIHLYHLSAQLLDQVPPLARPVARLVRQCCP